MIIKNLNINTIFKIIKADFMELSKLTYIKVRIIFFI